jgi:hypothetical protein
MFSFQNSSKYLRLKSGYLASKWLKIYSFNMLTFCLHITRTMLRLFLTKKSTSLSNSLNIMFSSTKFLFFVLFLCHGFGIGSEWITQNTFPMSRLGTLLCYKHLPWTFLNKHTIQKKTFLRLQCFNAFVLGNLRGWFETARQELATQSWNFSSASKTKGNTSMPDTTHYFAWSTYRCNSTNAITVRFHVGKS